MLEEGKPSDSDRYIVSVYQNNGLFKRMIFSKLHTLLKVEYFNTQSGVSVSSVEPRRGPSGLCILLKSVSLPEPIVLYEMPEVDDKIMKLADKSYTDLYVEATTNEGIIRYMSTAQTNQYMEIVDSVKQQIAESEKQQYLSDEDAPLALKLNVKDFNVKKNLASSIDITNAEEFICEYEEMDDEVILPDTVQESVEAAKEPDDQETSENIEAESDILAQKIMGVLAQTQTTQVEDPRKPDKVIESDDTSFYYYGELDSQGDRCGYGRTVTQDGKTAYEGCYLHDKRSGQGAYYYKDGGLCYAGSWEENRRSGVGVGVSSADGSIHVGKWVDNRPKGNGARFSSDGNIKFVCKETEDDQTFLFNFTSDDSVVVARYDGNGKKIGEKTIPLSNLIK